MGRKNYVVSLCTIFTRLNPKNIYYEHSLYQFLNSGIYNQVNVHVSVDLIISHIVEIMTVFGQFLYVAVYCSSAMAKKFLGSMWLIFTIKTLQGQLI